MTETLEQTQPKTLNTQNIINNLFNKSVVIKAAPGSGRFFNKVNDPMQQFKGDDGRGQKVVVASNPYTAERFEGTMQYKSPKFNYSKRRFRIIDPEDITKQRELNGNTEVLQLLVKECRLINDIPQHPNFGQYITRADIFDQNDPFFINAKTKIKLDAGEKIVPTTGRDPLNVLVVLSLMTQKEFQVGSGNRMSPRKSSVRYIIVDRKIVKEEKKRKRNDDQRARKAYDKLDDENKMKFAIALGLTTLNGKYGPDIIDDLIYDYVTDSTTLIPKSNGKTKQGIFLHILDNGKGYLNALYVFNAAKSLGIITLTNGTYTAYGTNLGVTIDEAVNYLALDNNSGIYDRILEGINIKIG